MCPMNSELLSADAHTYRQQQFSGVEVEQVNLRRRLTIGVLLLTAALPRALLSYPDSSQNALPSFRVPSALQSSSYLLLGSAVHYKVSDKTTHCLWAKCLQSDI